MNVLIQHLCVLLASSKVKGNFINAEVVYDWVTVDYDWNESNYRYQTAVDSGYFIPENNVISGIKEFNGRVFVTVPRWKTGVPSTLNEIVYSSSNEAILKPFPNWEWQSTDNCNMLQYLQSMEIDMLTNTMWMLDTGRKYFSESNKSLINNDCSPKIIIWDLINDEFVHSYTFPDNVVNRTDNFLNDLVIDPIKQIAYISDVDGKSIITGAPGAIVVYDYKNDISNRFTDDRMSVLSMRYDDINNATYFDVCVIFFDFV